MKTITEVTKKLLPQSSKVVLNPKGYARLRGLPHEVMDIESNPMLWRTGLMASLVGVQVYVDRAVDESEAVFHLKAGSTMTIRIADMVNGCSDCGA